MKNHKFVGYIGEEEGMRKTREMNFIYFWFKINIVGCNAMRVGKSRERMARSGHVITWREGTVGGGGACVSWDCFFGAESVY
jgi:hypothetical protein